MSYLFIQNLIIVIQFIHIEFLKYLLQTSNKILQKKAHLFFLMKKEKNSSLIEVFKYFKIFQMNI